MARAPLEAGSYLYLRCNSTSWGVDAVSRLVPTENPDVLEAVMNVREPWMVTAGDDCTITETPELNGWGNWQNTYHAYLSVPGAGHVQRPYDATQQNFRMVFPKTGRFRAQLNRREQSLSVIEDAQGSGTAAWAAPGWLTKGADGALYRNSYSYGEASAVFARINPANGQNLWSMAPTQGSAYLQPECSSANTLVVKDGNAHVGLNPLTGAELWRTDLTALTGASTAYSNLTCGSAGLAYFQARDYASGVNIIGGLDRDTGAVAWWKRSADADWVALATADLALVRKENGLEALNGRDGTTRWTLATATSYPSLQSSGSDLLLVTDGSYPDYVVNRVDVNTGATLWSRPLSTGSVRLEQGKLYFQGSNLLERVEPTTGAAIWSFQSAEQWVYGLFPKSGKVLAVENGLRFTLLNADTGAAEWSRDDSASGYGDALEDAQGGVHLRRGKDLLFLDQATGATRWTFTAPQQLPDAYSYSSPYINSIADSDAGTLYVTYSAGGYRCPAMGVAAVDASTGSLRWDNYIKQTFWISATDSTQLIAGVGCRSAGNLLSIRK
jgi:hypothetical protein